MLLIKVIMGKPFETELQHLNQTYQWACKVPIESIQFFVNISRALPLVAVGSGGSLTAAHMAALLHQKAGMVSKAVTPLDLISSGKSIQDTSVLILSAEGRNSDIISAFRFAATSEPRQLMALCMKPQSPLSLISKEFHYAHFLDFTIPSGKDGFLATNSLLAFVTLLIRAYRETFSGNYTLPKNIPSIQEVHEQLNTLAQPLLEKDTWVVLYGGWGLPAAVDAESKFTEAALRHVQIADFRNFAHGRHYWLARRGAETGIIALITPDEKNLADKTLRLIPKDVPSLQVITDKSGPIGGLELLIKILYLVKLVGTAQGIDPGMPGVPSFGRRIYHLRLSSLNMNSYLSHGIDRQGAMAILRKCNHLSIAEVDDEDFKYWKQAYQEYNRRLERTSFGAVVFDYDGTLCDPRERYSGPPGKIGQELVRLLKGGSFIGIATGRGKSVRDDLRRLIPKNYWKRVLVGYYNGSDIALLKDPKHPDRSRSLDASLQPIKDSLKHHQYFNRIARYECRPNQISVEPTKEALWKNTKIILLDIVIKANVPGVEVLESSHSIDIIAPGVSKLRLVAACKEAAKQAGNPEAMLCIGDKGKWPGNDYGLLSTPYSLSVDTVSPDPGSCWNLSKPGHRGIQATLDYLNCIKASDGILHFSQKGRK